MFKDLPVDEIPDIIRFYQNEYEDKMDAYCRKELKLKIFVPRIDTLRSILKQAANLFKLEKTVLEIQSPCIVLGDIHGQLIDLLRIFHFNGFPPLRKYIFLGDLVDRGDFSMEVLVLIFSLKIMYPNQVYVLRGNHEWQDTQFKECFINSAIEEWRTPDIAKWVNNAFNQMPYAAIIDKYALCIHGGVGPSIQKLDDIQNIKRPGPIMDDEVATELTWSDPFDNIPLYMSSPRGVGYLFGQNALNSFLRNSGLELIVRGHECVNEGVRYSLNKLCITVFSASNYCGQNTNKSGILVFNPGTKPEGLAFDPLPWVTKAEAVNQTSSPIEKRGYYIKPSSSEKLLSNFRNQMVPQVSKPKLNKSGTITGLPPITGLNSPPKLPSL
ncbi:Ser/Thr protein phosphatase, putative [Trichomonas vaginalis G3]|uniref:Serine/threonine-protein phosphatase n=1 Tax=Trichomonas vaginalis (strain ATCC PRA-98 / G3) TaxID=412133 RepID=A2FI45_TRIV3|nr:phosphoprotein phosphatase protein [Trichomonas vaginalis G3]EAX95432.1 Ser/Thr protein phosphatase, putative [Trichomonas vaginalis G3]KAI5532213.1 phosphoprotein phosphatase protein [Trichomonas vaginalis G3]|eukprot:XP_001308362.1 Ser/Thr protein phosphatase [Trichomonas vaginalis G3]